MTPIVNPWLFYIIDVSMALKWTGMIACFIWGFLWVITLPDYEIDTSDKEWHDKIKHAYFIPILGILLFIFIPGQETQYQMLVASYVTPDNLEAAGESIQTLIEYIIDCAKQLIG